MKRVIVDQFGGPEVLRVVKDEEPRPGPGEVRIRVLTAGVSLTDAQLRAGTYLGVPRPPFTPGRLSMHWLDVVMPLAIGGIWMWAFIRELKRRPLLPLNDPYLKEVFAHDETVMRSPRAGRDGSLMKRGFV